MSITNFICKICGEQFSDDDIMKLHVEFMHEEEELICPHCTVITRQTKKTD